LPNISKINAVDIGNIAKVDGATSSNIAKVDGLTIPSAAATEPYLAYSVRQLGATLGISYTGPCLRARRTSDGVEADVEFDSGVISLNSTISNTSASETTFGDFVGHGGTPTDAIVTVWYDQSSTGINMEDRNVSQAFQIYDATGGLSDLGGQPCLDGSHQSLTFLKTVSTITMSTDSSVGYYLVGDHMSSGGTDYCIGYLTGNEGIRVTRYFGEGDLDSLVYTASGQWIMSAHTEGSTASVYIDNSLNASKTLTGTKQTASNTLNIGMQGPYNAPWDGKIQEFLFYNSTSISNRAVIATNQNSFFSVY